MAYAKKESMSSPETIDLGTFTVDDAQRFVDKVFAVSVDGTEVQLKLIEASAIEIRARRRSPSPKRPPFSVFFLGPRDPVLPQAPYTLTNDDTRFEGIFIVPIGRDDEGTEY